MTKENQTGAKTYIEVLRIIAAFLVIYNHTGVNGFFLFTLYPSDGVQYWIYLYLSIFCKIAVPLFFMISGSLLLNDHGWENDERKNKNRLVRIVAILVIFSLINYLWLIQRGYETFDLRDFVVKLFQSDWNSSYWYLYAYISFLITLPFMKRLVNVEGGGAASNYFIYLIILAIVFNGIIPCVQYWVWNDHEGLNGNINVNWLLGSTVLYPATGFFLEKLLDKRKYCKKSLMYMWFASFVCIGISSYMTYYRSMITGVYTEADHMSFIIVPSITVFITVKYIIENLTLKLWMLKIIYSISKCTFGIYLFHTMLLWDEHTSAILTMFLDFFNWNRFVSIILYCLIIMFIGYILTLILKKVPLISKLL